MKQIKPFLRKIHLFALLFWGTWSFLAWDFAIGLLPDYFIDLIAGRNIDEYATVSRIHLSLLIVGVVVGIIVSFLFLKKPSSKGRFACFLVWLFAIPAVVFIAGLIGFDSFYSFGGFMPGMAALWTGIYLTFGLVCCIVMAAVMLLWWGINKKRGTLDSVGTYPEGQKVTRFMDVLNGIGFAAALLVIGFLFVSICSAWIDSEKIKKDVRETEAFHQEVVSTNPGYDEENLLSEAFIYAWVCELAVTDEGSLDVVMNEEPEDSPYDLQVIQEGMEHLKAFTAGRRYYRGVDMINAHVEYDYKGQLVQCCFEMSLIWDDATHDCWAIVSYDKNMNIVSVTYEED